MDHSAGKGNNFGPRRSVRAVTGPAATTSPNEDDDSYQPNTGLVLMDDNDDADPPQSHATSLPSQPGIPGLSKRPSSILKPADHLTLNSSQPPMMGIVPGPSHPPHIPAPTSSDAASDPMHSYGLFQNTVPVEEAPDMTPMLPATTGGYHRSIDSVGADLMGPIGHTEELPPYTRFPEEAHARGDHARVARSIAPVQPIPPGAGGIGLATLNPEFEPSVDDLNSPRSRLSARSMSNDSSHEINTAAKDLAEKDEPSKWQRRARKRAWGVIPYWALCLVTVALLLMGAILGAVIGTFLGKDGDDNWDDPYRNPGPRRIPIDGSDVYGLTSLPDGVPPLATGNYTLSPLITKNAPNSCFAVSEQQQTWSCSFPYSMYDLSVEEVPDESNASNYVAALSTITFADNHNMPKYPWGASPPSLPGLVHMQLVQDMFEPDQGPAWWARISFNKTVIIHQNDMSESTTTKTARWLGGHTKQVIPGNDWGNPGDNDDHDDDDDDDKKYGLEDALKFGAAEGDKPWICSWPGTVLEVFVYPQQDSNDGGSPEGTACTTSCSTNAPAPAPTPTASNSPTSMSTDWPPFEDNPPKPGEYPKVFKFKERRVAHLGSTAASCRQVEIVNDGEGDIPVLGSNGKPVEITIEETAESLGLRRRGPRGRMPAASELTECGCLWWVF